MQIDINPALTIITPVLIVANEALKGIGMPKKWCVIVNLVGGTILGLLLGGLSLESGIAGFLVGGAAGGIYDGKIFLEGKAK